MRLMVESDTITLNEDNITLDGGIYLKTYCLGDYIWEDINMDGVQDDTESGISDVNVHSI